jgi:predicted DCC family thiol-disulfide oxidoreductase YuxK
MSILKRDWIIANRKLTIVSILILFIVFSGSLLLVFFGSWLIEWTSRAESIELINRLMVEGKKYDLPYLRVDSALNRIVIIIDALSLILVASLLNPRIRRTVKAFFTEKTHPINLAVFRIVLFLTVVTTAAESDVIWFSEFPKELLFAPTGLGWLFGYIPLNELWAKVSTLLFLLFCFTGMMGFFTRTSALLALILGFYVLGIPQFFGKVRHYHHLIWFLAILAASRCGDALSIDAIFAARKRADLGIADPPGSSPAYALPLRFVWLLMGVIYFFPGFWKFVLAGPDWAFSDNLKFRLYKTWFEYGNWVPFFRIDHYPLLYKLAALATMIFELSFIFIIFFPGIRLLAALGGLLFHNLTYVLMRIPFWWLQPCYVSFFDWYAVFKRIGHWFYRDEMSVFYDGNCKSCIRKIAYFRVFDVFGRVSYVPVTDEGGTQDKDCHSMDYPSIKKHIYASVGSRHLQGIDVFREVAKRIPVLWPASLFLSIWPLTLITRRIRDRAHLSRKPFFAGERPLKTDDFGSARPSSATIVTVGVFLMFMNALCGVGHIVSSWPFACYPTFERIIGPQSTIQSLSISSNNKSGETTILDGHSLSREFYWSRSLGLTQHILSTDDQELLRLRLKALLKVWSQKDSRLRRSDTVRFYKAILFPAPPEQRGANTVRRELLFELKLNQD